LVEQRIENPRVPGSIPGRGTIIQEALHENAGLFDFKPQFNFPNKTGYSKN
tara:strand:+ start:6909 stop:7061 length:153 start_codon:yes stop_codon:yes gene_type:complete